MSASYPAQRKISLYTAFGALVWAAWFAFHPPGAEPRSALNLLAMFAVLVITPLAVSLTAEPDRLGSLPLPYKALVAIYPAAAVLAMGSFWLQPGIWAGMLVLPWTLFTAAVAAWGFQRFTSGPASIEETCIDFGLVYTLVGGVWLIFSRWGVPFLGFSEPIVTLTAIHFHYISLTALIATGMAGRIVLAVRPTAREIYRPLGFAMIAAPPLIALGIASWLIIETLGAILLALSMLALASLNLLVVVPSARRLLAKALLVVSSLAVIAAMMYAAGYALGRLGGWWSIPIATMVRTHGWLNALGFGLPALLAWRLEHPRSRTPAPGVPFSKLVGRRFIGPHFFEKMSGEEQGSPPSGLVDNMDEYRGLDFKPGSLHPDIRAFYERTARYRLLIHPDWKPGFHTLSWIYKRLSSKIGQMNLPLAPEGVEDRIESRIAPLDDQIDGRTNARAWIRTYEKTGEAVYMAAYANHTHQGRTYMNIAFPLPGGNLTSILRLETISGGEGGLLLTTLHKGAHVGDEGVYWVRGKYALRLPLNESIRVWAVDPTAEPVHAGFPTPANTRLIARHDMWLFGLPFLTLTYFIYPE